MEGLIELSKKSRPSSSGITYLGILQVLFIGLKLARVIDWPWWKVFLPSIVDITLTVLLVFIVVTYEKQHPHW